MQPHIPHVPFLLLGSESFDFTIGSNRGIGGVDEGRLVVDEIKRRKCPSRDESSTYRSLIAGVW